MHGDPLTLVDPEEAAEILGTTTGTLSDWRMKSQGPAYVRVGRRIRYRRSDLESYIESNTVRPSAPEPS